MPITTNEAADFKAAFMLAFDQNGLVPSDLKSKTVNLKYARQIVSTLTNEGLLYHSLVNDEDDVWQTPFSVDDTAREDAEAAIDEWITAQVGASNATQSGEKPAPRKSADKSPHPCLCGCGDLVPSKSFYRPGHDARHAGVVGREIAAEATMPAYAKSWQDRAVAKLEVLPSDRLRSKAQAIADKAIAKATAKADNAATAALKRNVTGKVESGEADPIVSVEAGSIKVGNKRYDATRSGDKITYTDAKGEVKPASKTAAKTFEVAA